MPMPFSPRWPNMNMPSKTAMWGLTGDVGRTFLRAQIGYGYGLAIRELDDGSAVVTYILDGGPAQKAGVKKGAVLVQFNGATT